MSDEPIDLNFDFDRLRIEQATATFDMPWVAPGAKLICRPANEANTAWHEALLKVSGARVRAAGAAAQGTRGDLAASKQDRDDDRRIYPGTVVVGWAGILNRKNEAVPFSIDACAALLRQLPSWIIDRLRVFAMRPENFIAPSAVPAPDAVALAGNSQSA